MSDAPGTLHEADHADLDRAGAIDALILEGLYRSGEPPEGEPPEDDADRPAIGIVETVLLHQLGATAAVVGGMVLFAPPGGGWAALPGQIRARPEMVPLFFAFGAMAGGPLSALGLMAAGRIGLRVSWFGSPPLLWAILVTPCTLVAAVFVIWAVLQVV